MGKNYFIGDLHGNVAGEEKFLNTKHFPEQKHLTKEDFVFQLGDFGYLWYYPEYKSEFKKQERQLDNLSKRNFTLFVIPGNHENYDLIYSLPLIYKFGDYVYEYTSLSGNKIYFAKRGSIYFINNKLIFTFGGATSTSLDKRYSLLDYKNGVIKSSKNKRYPKKISLRDISIWPQENASTEEKLFAINNLKKYNFKVDYILTHAAPSFIVDFFLKEDKEKLFCPTALYLNYLNYLIDFKFWLFGHYHENKIALGKYICSYKQKPIEFY
jgi:hypothetical protein